MNSLKKILFAGCLAGLFFSCEKDDVCIAPMTPKLVIRFYDAAHTDKIKSIQKFSLIVLPDNKKIIDNEKKDSIAIPLNVNKKQSEFIIMNGNNGDTIKFLYSTKNIFVSKACGYKSIFKDFQVSVRRDKKNWIDHVETLVHEINTDHKAHVKIFH